MEILKNQEHIVEIIDDGIEGEGIAKIDNFAIFIPNAIKGETIKIVIVKVLKNFAYGKVLEIIKKSPQRIEPDCKTYSRCGGCNLRHMSYKKTLEIKKNIVQNLVNKSLKTKIDVKPTIGMEEPFYYRNKAIFPVGISKENKPVMGVFANRTHAIIPFENCKIQNEKLQEISKYLFDFITKNNISIYNEKTGKGLVRNIVTRIGINTNQIMCIIVINGKALPKEDVLVSEINIKFPEVVSIIKNINTKNTNVVLGNENINLFGNGIIEEKLNAVTFKISPLSFFQVNSVQTENLYKLAIQSAGITKQDTVFDLYSGIGTIGIFVANYAKKVYGIEIVKDATKNAIQNAKLNKIENIEFINGDVEIVLDELVNKKNICADIILIDPPRKGMDNKSIENILKVQPKKIVYISCNPATLIRDIAKLEEKYMVKEIIPVDMFPFTSNVESVVVLERK